MKLPKARHDALFRLVVSDPERAAVLLRDYLPSEVVARLDPDRLPVHIEGTAIDGEGARTQADAIFRVYLRDGEDIIVYALMFQNHEGQRGLPGPEPDLEQRIALRPCAVGVHEIALELPGRDGPVDQIDNLFRQIFVEQFSSPPGIGDHPPP